MKILNNYTVLYAEDETIIRLNITKYLKRHFKDVFVAINGEEALKKFRENQPDVLILDINMPYIGGLELAKIIREEDETIPIIILTAYSETHLLIDAIDINITKYLIKPVSQHTLDEMIEQLARNFAKSLQHPNRVYFSNGYYFERNKEIVYNNQDHEIHLTKNEKRFIKCLIQSKNNFVTKERLEYGIWGDIALETDCQSRLKSLLTGIRKKISKEIIKNDYALGYRLELKPEN